MAVATPSAPSPGADTPFVRTFPCTSCGARFSFAPGTTELKCEYCGAANQIAEDDSRVEELPFDQWISELAGKMETEERAHVRCDKCGAEQDLPADHFAAHCAFCGAGIVAKEYANRLVKPRSLVPFQVDKARAQDEYRRWIRKRWLAPGDLKRYAKTDMALDGVYLPFWTYDARTSSDYVGERGDDYYVDESYTVTNNRGESEVRTRRRKETRWSPASGHVDRFHDDVMVRASTSLPDSIMGSCARWNLKGLVPYKPEYVSGFRAEAYAIGLKDGWPVAKAQVDDAIAAAIRRDIGGDQQRIHRVSTRYSDVTFKHVLLPAWISAYRYRDKAYRFVVNGQTGEVSGEAPVSWWKVAFLALGVIVLVILFLSLQGPS